MALALFDLDQTLINGDSDYLWGEFLVEKKLVDKIKYQKTNKKFFEDYKNGVLNINKYLEFCLQPLSQHNMEKLLKLRLEFVESKIKPIIYPQAIKAIAEHNKRGDFLIIISSTNEFIIQGVAKLFNINHPIATEVEIIDNKYSGKPKGTPCFREGKIIKLNQYLKETNLSLENSYFYSDSFNDKPLLEFVANPVVVNPDNKLKDFANQNNWDIREWQL